MDWCLAAEAFVFAGLKRLGRANIIRYALVNLCFPLPIPYSLDTRLQSNVCKTMFDDPRPRFPVGVYNKTTGYYWELVQKKMEHRVQEQSRVKKPLDDKPAKKKDLLL